MSALIVVCPHCLTWIDCHGECCAECGKRLQLEDGDPPSSAVDTMLGEFLADLGDVKLLLRRGWPNMGRLVASTEGLLFLPEFSIRPNGSLEAVIEDQIPGTDRVRNLIHWWSVPPWRRPIEPSEQEPVVPSLDVPLRELLYDSPGAVFIAIASMRRLKSHWGRIQIHRSPTRIVTIAPASPATQLRSSFRALIEFVPWRVLVAEL